ncbi:ino eighty subunit 1 [Bimuria novae-zelandiae CBS 107.79]|uniref:Ino eighty subunit 1 n=1 Tax=Bimuria novae-zelandiae CBS 107.79 TaxID=1447943 RepID=A0A6A5UKK3_9PLEO|nr:ino eighty subunit 1 [Bimuria novae-zelandiae CBS 107.79]
MDAPSSAAPDSRTSLRHILAADPTPMDDARPSPSSLPNTPGPDESEAGQGDSEEGARSQRPYYTANATTMRRNANGSVSSVYSGNKIRHLKKDDGIPLWRKDIQYDFLRYVFDDEQKVFSKMDGDKGFTFADIYLDAMAKSSKCSKILKDKLLTERPAAVNMAMVCLLVNVGRMNTTLNFFPEMRAQLRTYHSIPSLQAHQDPNAYKQLQDAPRLKSILKGATEDTEQPSTIEDIMDKPVPRTNPVNLIFVLSQYAPKISEVHFQPPRDFFDLVMRPNLSSRSRATAFLWLMWWYLESDFSKEDALRNPFGPGQYGAGEDQGPNSLPVKCPPFEFLTPEQEALENVDTPEEQEFGEQKRKERTVILASDMAPVVTGPKRTNKKAFNQNPVFSVVADDGASTPGRDRQSPSHGSARGRGSKLARSLVERDYGSDTDRTRSASPPGSVYNTGKKATPNMRINTLLNEDSPASTPASKGPGRGNWSRKVASAARGFKSRLDAAAFQDGQSPSGNAPTFSGPHGFYLPLNGSDPTHKRTRPLTQHQLAVEQYRRRRVDVILDRGIRKEYKLAAKRRQAQAPLLRAWIRCKGVKDSYDSEEDINESYQQDGDLRTQRTEPPLPAGLVPIDFGGEENDYGEECYYRAKMLSRVMRRMDSWDENKGAVRTKPKGSRRHVENDPGRINGEDDFADEDEEMQDAYDMERRDDSDEDEDEDERMYDRHTLPPLPQYD